MIGLCLSREWKAVLITGYQYGQQGYPSLLTKNGETVRIIRRRVDTKKKQPINSKETIKSNMKALHLLKAYLKDFNNGGRSHNLYQMHVQPISDYSQSVQSVTVNQKSDLGEEIAIRQANGQNVTK